MSILSSSCVSMRWINTQCFEIKLPDGKTLITDPFFEKPISPMASQMYAMPMEFDVSQLEGCDYVVINHTHADHCLSLGKIYERFHPMIICHASVARALSNCFDIPTVDFYGFDIGQTYDFGSFQLSTYHATHNPIPRKPPSQTGDPTLRDFGFEGGGELMELGMFYNVNFVFTLPNNFRIGFAAGTELKQLWEQWRDVRPNLLLQQRSKSPDPADYAALIEGVGAQLMLTMHHEGDMNRGRDMNAYCDAVNELLISRGNCGRVLTPKQLQWYDISLQISPRG